MDRAAECYNGYLDSYLPVIVHKVSELKEYLYLERGYLCEILSCSQKLTYKDSRLRGCLPINCH